MAKRSGWARRLDRTLASLAAQTRQPDELIASDDASPDETPSVVEGLRLRAGIR